MDAKSKLLTLDLLRAWAASKPNPDAPVAFQGSKAISAKDYIREVEQETDFGKSFCDFMETQSKKCGKPLDVYLRENIRPDPPPAP